MGKRINTNGTPLAAQETKSDRSRGRNGKVRKMDLESK